ncbi:MAG: plasmid mobilization relaxosome protein MobC [Sphingomonadales bacterium]|nr:plasmid mobilization relaxosome protein MobC [Sphingomonadales bacterium]
MATGSDKRQRTRLITFRVTEEEYARYIERASRAGLAVGAFARAAGLEGAGPRARRRRPVEHTTLVQLMASMNRVGNNLNQIARNTNLGLDIDVPRLRDALTEYHAVIAAIYDALGMEPARDHQGARAALAPGRPPLTLARAQTKERIEILQLDSAGTTEQAFRDWQTYTPPPRASSAFSRELRPRRQQEMSRDQWLRAVEVLEEELGLQGQPRAIVMHEKNGREHIHVVWARTDMGTMKLRSDSMNYQAVDCR